MLTAMAGCGGAAVTVGCGVSFTMKMKSVKLVGVVFCTVYVAEALPGTVTVFVALAAVSVNSPAVHGAGGGVVGGGVAVGVGDGDPESDGVGSTAGAGPVTFCDEAAATPIEERPTSAPITVATTNLRERMCSGPRFGHEVE